ncbi:MAG: dihydroorotase [Phycisphaerales bacterium]
MKNSDTHTPGPLLIRNAHIVCPMTGRDGPGDVLVRDGAIADVGTGLDHAGGATEIDASGKFLAPAFVEPHAHLREPGGESSETIASASHAAARGGYCVVFGMPNTRPICDSPGVVRFVLDRAAQPEASGVRVIPVAAVSRGMGGESLTDFAVLRAAGAGALSDDGLPVANAEVMRRAMQWAAELGMVVLDHCEDLALTGPGVMHEGRVSARLGLPGLTRLSESTCVARDCALAHETGCRLHVCHLSVKESVEAVRHWKSRGAPVTAEVSPHHLCLTDEDVERLGTHGKMKPPLGDEDDRAALIEGLEDGTIDCIATDHAPHAPHTKALPMEEAPFGVIGMESAFASLHAEFVQTGRWTLGFLIERMSTAPARCVNLEPPRIEAGAPADLVLIDPGLGACEDPDGSRWLGSRSRNGWWDWSKRGAGVVLTVVEGRIAFDARSILSAATR